MKRKLALFTAFVVLVALSVVFVPFNVRGQNANFPAGGTSGGGQFFNVLPSATTLLGWYQIPATDSAATLTDSSGNGRTGGGTTGTAPTITAVTGGLACNNAGGALLPAALNSAKTIMVWMTAGIQTHGSSGIVTGSGATWTAFNLLQQTNSNALSPQDIDSTSGRSTTRYDFWGTGSLAETFDTNNRIYMNGVEYTGNYFSNSNGSSSGIQAAGQYSVCGFVQGTSSNFLNTGTIIYQVAMWSNVLTAAQIASADQVMNSMEASAGVFRSIFNNTLDTSNQILGTADSIGAGAGITQAVMNTSSSVGSMTLDDTWVQSNLATSGFTLQNLTQSVPSFIGQLRPQSVQNIHLIWGSTNDIVTNASTAAATLGYLTNMCRQSRAAVTSAKCLVVDMMDVTGSDAGKNGYDALFRQKWSNFADGAIDLASDPNMGADGAGANTLYFLDGKHPTQHASYNDITPMIQRGINRMYACHDFSCATVYASSAPAASAVTATAEATNTMTFTTALNPPVGSSVVCTGITPAGYNSPNTGWLVLTTSAGSFTAFNGTTALGAGSVFGVCSVPLQKDKDVYSIINFGAANYSLESCMGYTGQNLYIRNINVAGSTLVPFASETITGPGTTTIAAATTAILQSQLVSSAAGGCNWVRIQ